MNTINQIQDEIDDFQEIEKQQGKYYLGNCTCACCTCSGDNCNYDSIIDWQDEDEEEDDSNRDNTSNRGDGDNGEDEDNEEDEEEDQPKSHRSLIMNNSVSVETFFKYKANYIEKVINWDQVNGNPCKINILKLEINDNMYFVSIKTYWIRLIQRHWKKIFQQRQEKITYHNLRSRELSIKHNLVLPNIVGMIRMYNKIKRL